MSKQYSRVYNKNETPQSEPIPGTNQVKNNAGGFVWELDKWSRLDRFLIIGSIGGNYYVREARLTDENMKNLHACMEEDAMRVVNRIVEITTEARAPKKDPALFALAYVGSLSKSNVVRRYVYMEALQKVATIGTDILHFAEYTKALRGWGRLVRRGFSKWYEDKSPKALAYQVMKYRQRDGWSHRDVLRKAHPATPTLEHAQIYDWVCRGTTPTSESLTQLFAAIEVMGTESDAPTSAKHVATLVKDNELPREVVPTALLNSTVVWEALLEKMPMMAMVRNLGKLTNLGIVTPMSAHAKKICLSLTDPAYVQRSKMHPLAFLLAARTYGSGRGIKGSLAWTPVPQIVDALEEAFFLAFKNVVPMGNRVRLCLDVSGSMSYGFIANSHLSAAEASAALALVTARVEQDYQIVGFESSLVNLPITAKTTLAQALKIVSNRNFGSTDCSKPMIDARTKKMDFDTFVVYTDNETWAGSVHPSQALKTYMNFIGHPARLAVNGMTSTGFTIADPTSQYMMDFVGFDTATPNLMSAFARGEL